MNTKESRRPSNITPDDYFEAFGFAMKKLALAVDREMGEERMLIYFEKLRKYPIEEIRAAVDTAIEQEHYSVIPTVGKLIWYIQENQRSRQLQENKVLLEYKRGAWPEMMPERVKELLKPFWDRLEEAEKRERSEREERWKRNREFLKKQANLVGQDVDPARRK